MSRCLLYLALMFPLTLTQAQPQWHVNEASITFEITNAGLPVEGSFRGFEADVRFDPDDPRQSGIVASIDPATVETGIGLRNRHLRNHEYFHVKRYPHIRMESVRIDKTGPDAFESVFQLQIKDVAQEVTVPFTFTRKGRNGTLAGAFTINRLDFGLGEPSIILADEVTVYVSVDVAKDW